MRRGFPVVESGREVGPVFGAFWHASWERLIPGVFHFPTQLSDMVQKQGLGCGPE